MSDLPLTPKPQHPYLEQAKIDMHTYLPKEKGPLAKDMKNYALWTEKDLKGMTRWPWYSKFLLPFCKPKITFDETPELICQMTAKKLFGRTYITKTKLKRLALVTTQSKDEPK